MSDDPVTLAVDAAIARHRERPGALLPLLHDVQEALGWIPPAALPRIARALNLSRAEVHGVLTFYHDFRRRPPGRHVLQLCRAEACQAHGRDALDRARAAALGCRLARDDAPTARSRSSPSTASGNCARVAVLHARRRACTAR